LPYQVLGSAQVRFLISLFKLKKKKKKKKKKKERRRRRRKK
jgi:hypothetical protein